MGSPSGSRLVDNSFEVPLVERAIKDRGRLMEQA